MGILSNITGIASGGMTTVYKYLAIGGVVLALCVGSFFYGVHTESSKCKAAKEAVVIKADMNAEKLEEFQIQVVSKLVPIETTKIIKITQAAKDNQTAAKNDVTDSCILTQQWTDIYNNQIGQGK